MGGGDDDEDGMAFDLTALMDILSNIIFFLMASFGAAVVAMVQVTVPTISEAGDNDTARDEDKVTATMRVKPDGTVTISAANNEIEPGVLDAWKKSFPGRGGKIDKAAVNGHLWALKSEYKKSRDIMIVPDDDVTYEMLVNAMDIARNREVVVDGQMTYPSIFDRVVVSSLAK